MSRFGFGLGFNSNASTFASIFGSLTRNFTTSNLAGSESWPLDSNVPLTANFSITDKISTTSTAAGVLFSGGTAAGKLEVSLTAAGLVKVDVAGVNIFTGVIAVNDGKFNEIVLSRTGTTASLTVNGVSDGSGTMSGTVNFDTLNARTGGTIFFIGVQADIVVVDAGTTVHTWLIDETNPATISDITGSNNSTAVNFTSADSETFTKSGADFLGFDFWTNPPDVLQTGWVDDGGGQYTLTGDGSFQQLGMTSNIVSGLTYRASFNMVSLSANMKLQSTSGSVAITTTGGQIVMITADGAQLRYARISGITNCVIKDNIFQRILEAA